ncbi:13695_t:CDS:1 [Gigaspora rosea]|nr:13695_t:CDS:1 [Gigaspora rosea]
MLRAHYRFRRVPREFFEPKYQLPKSPAALKLSGKYTFPITELGKVKLFIEEIQDEYRILVPLPEEYSDLNFTNKEKLPQNPEHLKDPQVVIPIKTTKDLVETARYLRKRYFFRQIPSSWIDIPKIIPNPHQREEWGKKLRILRDLQTLIQIVTMYPLHKEVQLPITEYADVIPTTEILREYFDFTELPYYLTQLPDLPYFKWQIFNYNNE